MELRRVEGGDGYWQGRGSQHFRFSASEADLQQCLLQALPPEYAPYSFLLLDLRWGKQRADAGMHLAHHPVDQLPRCLDALLAERSSSRTSVFLGSAVLTPDLLRPPKNLSETSPLVAGLLELTGFSAQDRGERNPRVLSRLAYAREAYGGEVVQHDGYKAVLRALRLGLGQRSRAATKAAAARRRSKPNSAK